MAIDRSACGSLILRGRNDLSTARRRSGGFTLIELLVVIAIIAILAARMLGSQPSLSRAKVSAQATGPRQQREAVGDRPGRCMPTTTPGALVNNSSTADTRTYRQSWVNNIQDWGNQRGEHRSLLHFERQARVLCGQQHDGLQMPFGPIPGPKRSPAPKYFPQCDDGRSADHPKPLQPRLDTNPQNRAGPPPFRILHVYRGTSRHH